MSVVIFYICTSTCMCTASIRFLPLSLSYDLSAMYVLLRYINIGCPELGVMIGGNCSDIHQQMVVKITTH